MNQEILNETPENRIKRMQMRSWRRGIKEMDMILGPFSDTELVGMDAATLDTYDALLWENDQELYTWVNGTKPTPERFSAIITTVCAHTFKK
ncbi:succinate dehydrogenase assembly factor 2 [Falsihalocynthiibacter arcticus]|uniref:succinate dehydrogenase assembly factor 2 n=1 Tax=Falsihalocynthiibacter arcticus TaxID=1579316 RepID=UPI001F2D3CA3|nr:succinate dehydrogenase assembly factor 2 [Falsihalocynthiibacter arcticus]